MDANMAFGLLAGAVGLFDLVSVYLQRQTMPLRVRNLRLFAASLMLLVAMVVLSGLVKLG